jgi:hypothetical protein
MAEPLRIWMTGCVAVVMAALSTGRVVAAAEVAGQKRLSRFGLAETVHRLESGAASRGLSVFASVEQTASRDVGLGAVIVFESSRGGTPVLMDSDRTAPHLPLTLRVERDASGSTQVMLPGARREGLPTDVVQDLAQLHGLVADALA